MELNPDELCLAQACQQSRDLAVRLLAHPLHPDTTRALRAWLDNHAAPAAAAFMALAEQGPETIQARLTELRTARARRCAPASGPASAVAAGEVGGSRR